MPQNLISRPPRLFSPLRTAFPRVDVTLPSLLTTIDQAAALANDLLRTTAAEFPDAASIRVPLVNLSKNTTGYAVTAFRSVLLHRARSENGSHQARYNMQTTTALKAALLILLATALPAVGNAQLVNTPGTWSDVTTPTNGGGAFWDHASGDGSACNVGFFLLYQAGAGYGPCNNQKPSNAFVLGNAGRLGVGPNGPNGSYLSHTNFSFAPGRYRFEFLGEVAAIGPPVQQLNIFVNTLAPVALFPLYPVGIYPSALTTIFEYDIGQEWFLGANHADGGADYTTNTGPDHGWALFSSRKANANPGGTLDVMWAGFGDLEGGDQDYNDLVVQISSVPEPASIALMGVGLGALAMLSRRRRRA